MYLLYSYIYIDLYWIYKLLLKFSAKSVYRYNNQSSPVNQKANDERITEKLEEKSASQIIEDDDTEMIFDVPQKKNTDIPVKSNDIRHYQSISQKIEEDTEAQESQKNGTDKQIESKDTMHCQSASQMIDSESMDDEFFSKSDLLTICSKAEKKSDMDIKECVEDVSFLFLIFYLSLLIYKVIHFNLNN